MLHLAPSQRGIPSLPSTKDTLEWTLKGILTSSLFNKIVIYPQTYQLQKTDQLWDWLFYKGGIFKGAGNGMGIWDIQRQRLFAKQGCGRWPQLCPLLCPPLMRRNPPKTRKLERRVPAFQSDDKLPYQYLREDKQIHAVSSHESIPPGSPTKQCCFLGGFQGLLFPVQLSLLSFSFIHGLHCSWIGKTFTWKWHVQGMNST